MKKTYATDWTLLFLFALAAGSGMARHAAGHGGDAATGQLLAILHTATGSLFLITAIVHAAMHRNWYKGFVKYGAGKRSKITAALSVAFLLVSATGIVLIGRNGAHSPVGLWHYKIGIATTLLAIAHIIKRFALLRKASKR